MNDLDEIRLKCSEKTINKIDDFVEYTILNMKPEDIQLHIKKILDEHTREIYETVKMRGAG